MKLLSLKATQIIAWGEGFAKPQETVYSGLCSLKGSHTGHEMFDAFSVGILFTTVPGVSLAKPRFTPGYYLCRLQRQEDEQPTIQDTLLRFRPRCSSPS